MFISLSGIIASKNIGSLFFQLLFIPITIYFTYSVFIQFFDKKAKPVVSTTTNRGALFFTLVLFLILLVISITRVIKKPGSQLPTTKHQPLTKLSPSPKVIITPYLKVKDEYEEDIINVRQSASSASKILGVLDSKAKYRIVSKNNEWFEILFNKGVKGFVHEKFVTNL